MTDLHSEDLPPYSPLQPGDQPLPEVSSSTGEPPTTITQQVESGAPGSFEAADSSRMLSSSSMSSSINRQPLNAHKPEDGNKDGTVSRTPSYTPGKEVLNVDKRRSVSYSQGPEPRSEVPDVNARLRRRNGVRLPKIFTGLHTSKDPSSTTSLTPASALSSGSPVSQRTRSAGPTFASDEAPRSPSYIGRGATGLFPKESITTKPMEAAKPADAPTLLLHSPAQIEEEYAETHPPPMDSENDVSIHYTRLIRTIDRDHRKALHERDKELSQMRERLHEVDQVYRQELKARDFIIDDLKKRLQNHEELMQGKLERARNEVEDLWEARWKDRDRHLVDRMKRIELDSQKSLEKAIRDRDEAWTAEWAKKNEQLVQRLKAAEEALVRGENSVGG